jgi:hypothetical protein
MMALGQNLRHKSTAYSDPSLGSLFMFNNLQYIGQTVGRDKSLNGLMQAENHQGQSSLATQFEAEAETYLQRFLEGWGRIGSFFGIELESGDERRMVKMVFSVSTKYFPYLFYSSEFHP